jgi:cell wall-associated NlpC family hydrolase
MVRDLFAPFGIYLPRNSSAQAKAGRPCRLRA